MNDKSRWSQIRSDEISCSHIHLLQDETFKVEQGVLGVIKDGVEYTLTKDDGNFFVPRGSRYVVT